MAAASHVNSQLQERSKLNFGHLGHKQLAPLTVKLLSRLVGLLLAKSVPAPQEALALLERVAQG